MNVPGASTLTINDLIPKVQAALQNRSDITEAQPNPEMRPSSWIRDTLRELTANYPFEELRQPNPPLVTIGPGLGVGGSSYKYLVSSFVNSGDDLTLMEDPVIFLDSPNNQVPYPMDYLTPKAIAPLLASVGGIPFKYTRYGTQFWFGSQPGSNFSVYLPYQVRHPFSDDNLTTSPVMIPQDWLDICAYGAAERGAIANRWNDQRDQLHKILYGDPKSQLKDGSLGMPGLIAVHLTQMERDRRLSVIQMTPMVQRY